MESIKSFINKHKWIVTISSIIFIFLPQYIDSIWDLAEKMSGRTITVHHVMWVYWITVPIAIVMFGIAIWAIRSSKNTVEVKTETVDKSTNLTETLTAMHRRLIGIQKEKASQTKIGLRQLDKVSPMLADRMGTIKLNDWPKFKDEVKRRLQRAMPHQNYLHPLGFIQLMEKREIAALSVASQIRKELFQTKEWTFEDTKIISKWLD